MNRLYSFTSSCATVMLGLLAIFFAYPFGTAHAETSYTTLKNQRLSLLINEKTGRLDSIQLDGNEIARIDSTRQWFDLNLEGKWQYGKHPIELLSITKENENSAAVQVGFGDWKLTFRYKIDSVEPLYSTSFDLAYYGEDEIKLKGFWHDFPWSKFESGSKFFGPGSYPPIQYELTQLEEGFKKAFSKATPSLIVEKTAQRSFLYILDDACPNADTGSLTAEVNKEYLRPTVNYGILARMKQGTSQELGTAWCWILDTNGEKTMQRIHDWMAKVGHVIPRDRPKWFEGASIYSFHPGGTIGSGCKDLGGFRNSLALTDRIKQINLNTIWFMPLEDVSIYCPRDYYKFQEGLGTGEDYRLLVEKAHQLGIHVLQDIVPHGGRNTFQRALDHPEWLLYDEEGKTLDYWCFDFNWPSWQKYMEDVARYYVTEYNIDGYRVDAVSGSKVANWNPDIPYSRASYALRQGGLNMLRSIRQGVKEVKPTDGAILAETQGSVFGIVSDAVYDFRGCYTLFQDVRRLAPARFVENISRFLHEENYSEIKDLLRFRHAESHDSLRSQLWYGIEPARAILALTTFIHGIPLVYHEQENGNIDSIRTLFGIKNLLPELQGGDADYLGVQVPPGVFAVHRSKEENSSIALINFNEQSVEFDLAAPNVPVVTDMMAEKTIAVQDEKIRVVLAPYQYNVFALRKLDTSLFQTNDANATANLSESTSRSSVSSEPSVLISKDSMVSDEMITLSGDHYQAFIDKKSGMLLSYQSDEQPLLGKSELYLPSGWKEDAQNVELHITQKDGTVGAATFRIPFGSQLLRIRYTAEKEGLKIDSEWSGDLPPENALLAFPAINAVRWKAATAEGTLADEHRLRPEGARAGTSSIYWRLQGTDMLFDSLLYPLDGTLMRTPALEAISTSGKSCSFQFRDIPSRVQWTSRIESDLRLTALLSWTSSEVPSSTSVPSAKWSVTIRPSAMDERATTPSNSFASTSPRPWRIVPIAGGWLFENVSYRLLLYRNGSIRSLILKEEGKEETVIIDRGEVYTDYGLGEKGLNYSTINEVEAASCIIPEGKNLRLLFSGRLRGMGRFELLRPGLSYQIEYLLGESPSFEISYGIESVSKTSSPRSFVAFRAAMVNIDSWQFLLKGNILAQGKNQEIKGRAWQSKEKESPDVIRLFSQEKPLLTLTDFQGITPQNIFINQMNFFMAFCDGEEFLTTNEGRWSILCTVGDAAPARITKRAPIENRQKMSEGSILVNGDFEKTSDTWLTSSQTDKKLILSPQASHGWQLPVGGQIVIDKNAPSARHLLEISNVTGEYLMARQMIPLTKEQTNKRLKLTAMVKGEQITQGDTNWKVGCLRWVVQTEGKTEYISSPSLLGTFDWKKVEVILPLNVNKQSISVELGLNGSLGHIWFDNVTIEPVLD